MIPYATYKLIHLLGILFVFFALGGATLHALNGGSKASNPGRKLVAISHGLGLLIILVAGFGLMPHAGVAHGGSWPLWIWLKLVIWLLLGGVITLLGRKPGLARPLWFAIPVLGALAVYAAIQKPV